MFSKTSKGSSNQSAPQTTAKAAGPSIISADLRIIGDLTSEGEIQIDGTVDGDIRTKSLLVGETANIKGEIVSDKVQVHGTINGQIKARSVTLARSARVTGDILHEDLAIENGAFLEGHCKRLVEKKDLDAVKKTAGGAAVGTVKPTPAAAE